MPGDAARAVAVHGLIYGLEDGILRHLGLSMTSDAELVAYKQSQPTQRRAAARGG